MTSKQAAWRVACARLVRLSTDMSNSGSPVLRRIVLLGAAAAVSLGAAAIRAGAGLTLSLALR